LKELRTMNSLYSLKETANNVYGKQTTAIRIITNIKSKNMNRRRNTISDNYKELQPPQLALSWHKSSCFLTT